jgi:exosome complex exonuclease DIS3/RRP44
MLPRVNLISDSIYDSFPLYRAVKWYIEALDNTELLDMISDTRELDDGQQLIYSEHLTPAHLSNGIKSGKFHQGKLGISSHNYLEV